MLKEFDFTNINSFLVTADPYFQINASFANITAKIIVITV